MYRELSEETGEFFDIMVNEELMDLVNREGKRPGGFALLFLAMIGHIYFQILMELTMILPYLPMKLVMHFNAIQVKISH